MASLCTSVTDQRPATAGPRARLQDPKQVVTYLSEKGLIIKQGEAAYLRMDQGHIVRKLPDQPAPQIIVFDRYVVDLAQPRAARRANGRRPPARRSHGPS